MDREARAKLGYIASFPGHSQVFQWYNIQESQEEWPSGNEAVYM
jgi:hypothetical protein